MRRGAKARGTAWQRVATVEPGEDVELSDEEPWSWRSVLMDVLCAIACSSLLSLIIVLLLVKDPPASPPAAGLAPPPPPLFDAAQGRRLGPRSSRRRHSAQTELGTRPFDASELNARFEHGAPSNNLSHAGVLLHSFDTLSFNRWADLKSHPPWLPCPASNAQCSRYRDRFSASLVSARVPFVFSDREPGFVLSPFPAAEALLCAYPGDGSSVAKRCTPPGLSETCSPGCFAGRGSRCHNSWRVGSQQRTFHGEGCYDAAHLERALETHEQMNSPSNIDWCKQGTGCRHNELVLDASRWVARLPRIVSAVFYSAKAGPEGRDLARRTHAAFVETYGDVRVPLLELDVTRDSGAFRVVQ